MITRPYQQVYDSSTARTISPMLDNVVNNEFVTSGAQNRRALLNSNGQAYPVADMGVNPRGAKNIVWSSEGYIWNGVTISALTTNQKKATNSSTTTIATTQTLPNVAPNAISLPTTLDFSAYGGGLLLVVNLSAITGTNIQFELDTIDDAGTPNVIPLWKPAAATAATSYLVMISPYATGTAPTISGWTVTNVPFSPGVQGKFAWTASSLTAVTWTAFIYGLN